MLDLAVSAARIGIFDMDVATRSVRWDDRMLEIYGYTREVFERTPEAVAQRLHPDDRARVGAALRTAVQTCGPYEADYRIVLPDGQVRWVAARGRAVCDEDGVTVRVLGAAHDTTALREQEIRTAQVLESMSVGYLAIDRDWRYTYANAEAARILGLTRAELVGGGVWELFPAAVGTPFEDNYRLAMSTGTPVTFDAYYPAPLDAWLEVRVWPATWGLSVYFLDVTGRRRAQEAAERAAIRSALLADVAAVLAGSLDAASVVDQLPRLLVPALADWCILTVADEGSGPWRERLHDVSAWHADPALRPAADRYAALRMQALGDPSSISTALDTGRPVVLTAEEIDAATPAELSPEAREALGELAPRAIAVIPMFGRGHPVGVLTAYNGGQRGDVASSDLATLQEVAAQVGLALDNARLTAAQRSLAEELQRSLLTELPEPAGLQIVARYVPATGAQIGGDWYDAFATDAGVALVIGDVAGHDRGAAVAMAQVRNILRGVAQAVSDSPARVLAALDTAMTNLAFTPLTTVVLARVEQVERVEDAAGDQRVLRWSNAGHPPPLLIDASGRAQLLERPADLLLGLSGEADRHDHTQILAPCSTVVLYTDGLVERRGENLDDGLERLRARADHWAGVGLDLDALCDALLAELADGVDDDVAVLAIRVRPEEGGGPGAQR